MSFDLGPQLAFDAPVRVHQGATPIILSPDVSLDRQWALSPDARNLGEAYIGSARALGSARAALRQAVTSAVVSDDPAVEGAQSVLNAAERVHSYNFEAAVQYMVEILEPLSQPASNDGGN